MTRALTDFGHHFIVGLSGPSLSDLDKRILEEVQPIGVLLLKRNFEANASYPKWLAALESLLRSVKEYAGRDKMMISIDHEGGRVHRTPAPITHFPSAQKYVSHPFEVAKAMAIELRSLGINVSWAPVCDVHSNPENPVIGERAFSSSAPLVADAASKFARGLLENGVLACAKHFPGHGDTNVDSHKALPTLALTLEELRVRELVPFARLVNEGIPLVMTSHIVFPMLEPDVPATLSRKILHGLLREELGFQGVIVTDDLDMNAVAVNRNPESVVVDACRAGCELFCVARFPDGTSDKPRVMAQALADAANKDAEIAAASSLAREKIEFLVSKAMGHYAVRELEPAVFAEHQALVQRCTE